MKNALQVVVCGMDGSGKSTAVEGLKKYFDSNHINMPAIITRHPGATMVGREIRRLLVGQEYTIDRNTEALMFAADNSAYINQILKPSLEKGVSVIADRNNFISSLVYQVANGCDIDDLRKIHDVTGEAPKIDYLFFIRIPIDVAINRMKHRGGSKADRFEGRGLEFMRKVHAAYENVMHYPERYELDRYVISYDNVVIIDGTMPELEVQRDIASRIVASRVS